MENDGRYSIFNTHHAGYQGQRRRSSIDNASSEYSNSYSVHQASCSSAVTIERFLEEPASSFPSTRAPQADHHTMHTLPCPIERQYHSPTPSHVDSSYISSGWSDRQDTPFSSSQTVYSPYSPGNIYNGSTSYAYGGCQPADRQELTGNNCVSMPDVQMCADNLADSHLTDDDMFQFASFTYGQEPSGYEPLEPYEDDTPATSYSAPSLNDLHVPEVTTSERERPVIRRRRTQSSREVGPSPLLGTSSRVSKRPGAGKRSKSFQHRDEHAYHPTSSSSAIRPFPCPLAAYGCGASFGSKNEWKRHVNTQHLRLSFWRCDQCPDKPSSNDFNRKDLFTQHVRRMHLPNGRRQTTSNARSAARDDNADEQFLQDAAKRCYRIERSPPEQSCCIFCEKQFHGRGSWDERMEHIGGHFETAKKENDASKVDRVNWRIDNEAEQWMIRERIVERTDRGLMLSA